MAIPISNIESGEWNRYDRKTIRATIGGNPAELANAKFLLYDRPFGDLLLTKEGADVTITGDDSNIVQVVIGGETEEELLDDYALIEGGVYFWEIYDTDVPLKIANGYATIGHGAQPSA